MNKNLTTAVAMLICATSISASAPAVKSSKIGGHVGDRIDACIEKRVKAQNTDILVEPFRHNTEGTRWQTEFIGKWMLGAIASYRYQPDQQLLDKITDAAKQLMGTQQADGYIGNYTLEDQIGRAHV